MSARRIVLALARIEGRRLLRHPFILTAAALPVVSAVLVLLTSDDPDAGYEWSLLVPFMLFDGAVLVAVNLAALRGRRDHADELYASLPAPARARTSAHLLSLAWAVAAAAALVALAVLAFVIRGNSLPSIASAVSTPALVALCGALGLALARWLPHPAVAAVGVVGAFALANGGALAASRGLVVAGFVGLTVLCGVAALLPDRRRLG